ncbi:MAG: hypothetical protein HY360_15205 [Verrucomicrobia bacterium]|nr:hypothetical protein [Verrucomicrobiota bacterium]
MKTESICVREARAAEIAAIAAAMAESFRQYGGAFKKNPDWAREILRRDPGTTAAHTHVVTVGGQIASGFSVAAVFHTSARWRRSSFRPLAGTSAIVVTRAFLMA